MPVGLNSSVYSSCVLDHRYFNGSLLDHSGNDNHGEIEGNVRWSKEGNRTGLYFPFDGSLNRVVVTHDDSLNLVDGTIIAYWPPWWEGFKGHSRIVCKPGVYDFYRHATANQTLLITGNTSTSVHTVNDFKATNSLCATWENGALPSLYRDGAFHGDFNLVADVTPNNTGLHIGAASTTTPIQRQMDGVLIFNKKLSATQIADIHEWSQIQTTKAPINRFISLPTRAKAEDNCILDLSGEIVEGKAIDESGNNNHGTLKGALPHKGLVYNKGFYFNSDNKDYIDLTGLASTNKSYTFTFIIRSQDTGDTRMFSSSGLTISTCNTSEYLAYYDGSWKTTTTKVNDGSINYTTLVVDDTIGKGQFYVDGKKAGDELDYTGVNLSLCRISTSNSVTNFYKGFLEQFRIYEKAFTEEEVYQEYLKAANVIKHRISPGEYRISTKTETSGYLSNTPYKIKSGSFKIQDEIIEGKLTKSILCVTDGILELDRYISGNGGSLYIKRDGSEYKCLKDCAWIKTFNLLAGDTIAYVEHTVGRSELWTGDYFTWKSTDTDAEIIVQATAGTPYWIDWGDGDFESFTGTGATVTHSKAYGAAGDGTLSFLCEEPSGLVQFYARLQDIEGTIPDLSALGNLQELYLNNTGIEGTIPDLSALGNLQHLYLYTTGIEGTIPDLSALGNLQRLWLHVTGIEGTIPDLSALGNLIHLYLHVTGIEGTIPDLSALGNLQHLLLHTTGIEGTIPDLSALGNLTHLFLHTTGIEGTIPDLSGLPLVWVWLYSTGLSGYTRSTIATTCTQFRVDICQLDFDAVNGVLQDFTDNAAARPGGGLINLSGGTNAIPDAGILLAAQTALITNKPGDPWTIHVNS